MHIRQTNPIFILMKKLNLVCVLVILCLTMVKAQRLDPFTSMSGNYERNGITRMVPYPRITNYYGYTELQGQKDTSLIYFQLTDSITELGVRILSPAPDISTARPGDEVMDIFIDKPAKMKEFFNPVLRLEKLSDGKWLVVAENSDSPEAPPNPDGNRTNAIIRVFNNGNDARKSLGPGLYRIAFTEQKSPDYKGSYMLSVGSLEQEPEIELSTNLQDFEPADH
jgi:hypothetical protein